MHASCYQSSLGVQIPSHSFEAAKVPPSSGWVFSKAQSVYISAARDYMRCFLQLQLLKLHHIFHDWVGLGCCVCPTLHKSGNINRTSTCHLPASMNIVFHSGNRFHSGHETSVQSGDYRLHSKQCTHAIYGVGGFYGES